MDDGGGAFSSWEAVRLIHRFVPGIAGVREAHQMRESGCCTSTPCFGRIWAW